MPAVNKPAPLDTHRTAKAGTVIEFYAVEQAWWPTGEGPTEGKPTAKAKLVEDAVYEPVIGIRSRAAHFEVLPEPKAEAKAEAKPAREPAKVAVAPASEK